MHPHALKGLCDSSVGPYSPETTWGRKILAFLHRLSAADVPVLITGETGVGKEVLARAVHAQSLRANAPFLKLNCAALPSELIESELFGYERGAFTGAYKSTRGKFESAEGGTILLDEIGDMDLRLQAKLLQVLQDSQFLRVGGRREISVNVRVIAATHRDLPVAVRQGTFRQDLYYRLNVVSIAVPPLRERVDEIMPLVERFWNMYSTEADLSAQIPPVLKQAFMQHSWPGNIRELENTIRKFLVMQDADTLIQDLARSQSAVPMMPEYPSSLELPPMLASRSKEGEVVAQVTPVARAFGAAAASVESTTVVPANAYSRPVNPLPDVSGALSKMDERFKAAETEAIIGVLNSTLWNREQAAELLKVDYKALLYKMKKLGLSRRDHA